jgi:methylated-DNA-protein-cysteine methyltransferase-like protein
MSGSSIQDKHQAIYDAACQIPRGKVATYGQIALLAGLPGHARLAGYALYNLPRELHASVPWQRVINAKGRISYSEARHGNDHRQRKLLEHEGVVFGPDGRVDLKKFGWKPD